MHNQPQIGTSGSLLLVWSNSELVHWSTGPMVCLPGKPGKYFRDSKFTYTPRNFCLWNKEQAQLIDLLLLFTNSVVRVSKVQIHLNISEFIATFFHYAISKSVNTERMIMDLFGSAESLVSFS